MTDQRIGEVKQWLCNVRASPLFVSPARQIARAALEYIEELEATARRADAMAACLSTHDHTKHDAAMAAAREHLHTEET